MLHSCIMYPGKHYPTASVNCDGLTTCEGLLGKRQHKGQQCMCISAMYILKLATDMQGTAAPFSAGRLM
jgi:hypothetical protein